MSNEKRFVVKHGLQSQNIEFISPDRSKNISVSMLDSNAISFSGNVLLGSNTISANNVTITGAISANGSIGANGQALKSDGTKAYWSSVGSTYISSTPPLNPSEGDLWWDTDVAQLFIYYFDGSSFQWVQANRDILIEGPVGTYTLPGNLIATDVSVLGTLTETSDEKLKTNVATIKNPIDTAKKLRGVMFNWKDGGEESMGLIAQEVEQILPFLVSTQENGIKTLHYTAIIGLLIEAIKELSDKVDNK